MSQKSVVITGASTGIGAVCALQLDRLGWRVFAGIRKLADGEALQQQAADATHLGSVSHLRAVGAMHLESASHLRLTPILLDVTDPATLAAAVDTVAAAVGQAGLAGLVNNAGIALGGPLEFLALADLRRQLEVNVIGQIAVTQAFLPLLRQGQGRVINMGSISGRIATPFVGPYAASKFALEALTDSLRVELRPWGIDVAIIEPGPIATPIWEKSLALADDLLRNLPPRGHELYGPALAAAHQKVSRISQTGTPPEAVAQAVVHALTAKRPKTRYLVGRGVWLAALFAKLVPDRWRDRLVAR